MLGLGALGSDIDIEDAHGFAVRVDGASLEAVALEGDVWALRVDAAKGIGGSVVSDILEDGSHADSFTGDETSWSYAADEFQSGLTGGDDDFAFPCVAAAGSGGVDGEAGAVSNTSSDAVAETAQGNGGFSSEVVERSSAVDDGQVVVVAAQADVGGASSGIRADVLEGDVQVRLVADVSIGGSVAVNADVWAFQRSSRNSGKVRDLVDSSDADGHFAARGDRLNGDVGGARLVDGASAIEDAVLADTDV